MSGMPSCSRITRGRGCRWCGSRSRGHQGARWPEGDPDGHALLNLQIGKAGSQSSVDKFDVHDVLVEHFQLLFPAPNLGIGVAKHYRTVFGPRQIVIYLVAANDCCTRENIVNSSL